MAAFRGWTGWVLTVIAANAMVLVAGLVVEGHEQVFDTIYDAIVAFFLAELLVRLRAAGWAFVRGGWNCVDNTGDPGVASADLRCRSIHAADSQAPRLAHLMRHLPHLEIGPFRVAGKGGPRSADAAIPGVDSWR